MASDIPVKIMQEVYFAARGNLKMFHQRMCTLGRKPIESVNKQALYAKAKRMNSELTRLQKFKDKTEYTHLCNSTFTFPFVRKKVHANTGDEHLCKTQTNQENSKQVQFLMAENSRLKAKYRNIKLFRINDERKRNKNTIAALREKTKQLKKENYTLSNKPRNSRYMLCDKGVQCNITSTIVNELKEENEKLKSIVDENNNSENICEPNELNLRESAKGRPYSAKLREIIYEFRSRDIALQHINPLIQSVLSLVNTCIAIEDLPSSATSAKLNSELGQVSRIQLIEEIKNSEHITMHRDGTTKKGRHFYGVELANEEKTFTAGVREISDGKGETYANCVKEIVEDVSFGNSDVVFGKVTNFMTDRAATEQKVNNLLKPQIQTSHLHLDHTYHTEDDFEINDFKCAVHPLLQFAEVCLKDISKIEKEKDVKFEAIRNESNTHFLLRCISKLFYKDGSGDPLLTATFLLNKIEGLKKIPILNFRGNRFNVLFFNAAGTYILMEHVIEYLVTSKSSLNFMQNFILESLKDQTIIALLRALGILSKTITEPYWQFVQTSGVSAIEMGSVYQRLVSFLEECSENPGILLRNEGKLFVGPSEQDLMYQLLFESSSTDMETASFLSMFCSSLAIKCRNLFKPFLNGGKYSNPTEDEILKARTCSTNNINVEHLMAQVDRSLHTAPTRNIDTMESTVLYRNNNTQQWLQSKSDSEKSIIINKAMKSNTSRLLTIKKRKQILCDKHMETIQERQLCVKAKKDKEKMKMETAEHYVKHEGFWSKEEIDTKLSAMKTKKDKVEAIKNQIKLYKTLKKTSANDKHLLAFSSKGKSFNLDVLISNLTQLINKYNNQQQTVQIPLFSQPPQDLIGQQFKHIWTNEGADETWRGRILSYNEGIFSVSKYIPYIQQI